MADQWYGNAKVHMMKGEIALLSNTVKLMIVDGADYTFSAAHDNLADVPAGARVAISPALTGKTVTRSGDNAVFNATSPVTFTGITGDASEKVIVFVDSGVEATSYLLLHYDNASVVVSPNGLDIVATLNASGLGAI